MSSVAPLWGKPWRLGTASLACGLHHIDVDINIANIKLKELKVKKNYITSNLGHMILVRIW